MSSDPDPIAFAWQIAEGLMLDGLFISLTLVGIIAGLLLVRRLTLRGKPKITTSTSKVTDKLGNDRQEIEDEWWHAIK